jgi:hypothetical protein
MAARMRRILRFSLVMFGLAAVLTTGCVRYRHYTPTDAPVSRAGPVPPQPLPLRYRLTHFEVDTTNQVHTGPGLVFRALQAHQVRWRSEAVGDLRRAYTELYRSQEWMGTETKSDLEADFRAFAQIKVEEDGAIWIPGVLLYTLTASAGMAVGAGIGVAVDDSGFKVGSLMAGALGGLAVGLIAGSFIPTYRATVDVETRTRMEATALRGGAGGTFYEKVHDTHRTELYSGWFGGEDARSAFIGEAVEINQRQLLDHLREVGPEMLRSMVRGDRRGQSPLPQSEPGARRPDSQGQGPLPQSEPGARRPDSRGQSPLPQSEPGARRPDSQGQGPLPQSEPGARRPDSRGEAVRVFVSDVVVDATGLDDLGPVLASEIQVALQDGGRFRALTLENLEAQLRKEKRKALLSCANEGCVQRIIENFGIPDTIFGRAKALGNDSVHLTLTWTRAGDVLHAVTAVSTRDPGALLPATRDLAKRLAAAVAPMDGE